MELSGSDTTDPYGHETTKEPLAEKKNKLNISHVQPTQIEPQDAHWLRMDPSLTRSVLAKTEEELLGGLAALMRNKVEYEQLSRRLAQIQIDTEQAKHEFDTIRHQVRRADEEVASRIKEQSRVNEEIDRVRRELAILRDEHRQQTEIASGLKNETAQAQQSLADAQQRLSAVKAEAEARLAEHSEVTANLDRIKNEKMALEGVLTPLQTEIDERIGAREALIQQVTILDRHVSDLAARKEDQTVELSQLGNSHAELRNEIEGLRVQQGELSSEVESLRQSIAQHGTHKERHRAGCRRTATAATIDCRGTKERERAPDSESRHRAGRC
jgi:chromosome segregation ATPase